MKIILGFLLAMLTGCTMTVTISSPGELQQGSNLGVENSHQLEQLLSDQNRELEE